MRLGNFSFGNAGLVHQGTLDQARGPHPVHKATAYTSANLPVKDVAGSGEVYMNFSTAMEIIVVTVNAYGSTRSNTQIMLRVVSLKEELFDVPRVGNILVTQENEPAIQLLTCLCLICELGRALCPSEDILACKSKGSVHTPLGICGVTAGSTVAVAFKPAGPSSPPPAWQKFRGIGTGACGDRRRRSCCLGSLRAHSLWVP